MQVLLEKALDWHAKTRKHVGYDQGVAVVENLLELVGTIDRRGGACRIQNNHGADPDLQILPYLGK